MTLSLSNDFFYFISMITTANFFPNLDAKVILLALLLSISSCWIYIFANSIKSYRLFKTTSIEQKASENNNYYYNNKEALPFVSIIIPARNEQDNIEKCLVSLIKQNYPTTKFEIIVVDDNSTDNTLKRIKKIQQKYPRLKIIELKDKPDNWTGKKHGHRKKDILKVVMIYYYLLMQTVTIKTIAFYQQFRIC